MTKKLKIEYGPPEKLVPNGFNVNVVSPENEAKIDASITRLGLFKPILCRELPDGKLEIIGGEHRWLSAKRLGMKDVPYSNLGPLDDKQAREVSLIDNARFGSDDTLRLADLLDDLHISATELSTFMPYSESDFNAIFSSVSIALDDLDLGDDDEIAKTSSSKPAIQDTQILRFKLPIEDAEKVSALIKRTMKTQKFKDGDELQNAGDALVHILGESGAFGA